MRVVSVMLLVLACCQTLSAADVTPNVKKKGDPKSILLSGDIIELDTETQSLEATGNVTITFGLSVTTNVFSYSPKSGNVAFPETFSFKSGKNIITGKEFFYNVKTYKGQAKDLKMDVGRLQITGQSIDFLPLYFKMKNATFTTCPNPVGSKHFFVQSKTLYLYPEFGYVVAFNSHVHVKYMPFSIPVPTFIYGSKRYGLSSVTSLLPDIGTNRSKGIYIEQKIPYFKSNNSNGGVLLGYSEKLGSYGGAEHIQTINKNNSVELYGVQYSRDTFSGSASYHHMFGSDMFLDIGANLLEKVLKNFNAGQSLPLSQMVVTVKYRDILNDQRVSFLPMTQFEMNKVPLAHWGFQLTAKTYVGKVTEAQAAGDFTSWTGGGDFNMSRDVPILPGVDFHNGLLYYGSWYQNDLSWQRFYAQAGFKFKKTLFKPELIYTQNIFQPRGYSPFLFEQRYSLSGNELSLRLNHAFEYWKNWEITQITDYNVQTNQLRNCDISIGYRFHCWQINLNWRAVQQAFGFGFTIF